MEMDTLLAMAVMVTVMDLVTTDLATAITWARGQPTLSQKLSQNPGMALLTCLTEMDTHLAVMDLVTDMVVTDLGTAITWARGLPNLNQKLSQNPGMALLTCLMEMDTLLAVMVMDLVVTTMESRVVKLR